MTKPMSKFKTAICVLLAFVVTIAGLPFLSLAAAGEECYVLWDANSNTVKANLDGTVDAAMTESGAFAEVKKLTDGSGGYVTEFNQVGASAKAVATTSLNSKTTNFGWMANSSLLKALSPFVYISFEYKTESTEDLPQDAKLSLYAAQKSNSEMCLLTEVPLNTNGGWMKLEKKKISGTINKSWSDGLFTLKISDSQGNLVGTQTVSLKNIYLSINEEDRITANTAFNKVSGIKSISNFSAGVYISKDKKRQNDYFKLLTGYDKKSPLSTNLSDNIYNITVKQCENADVYVSQVVAAGSEDGLSSESVAINTTLADRYKIKKVKVKKTNGELVNVITSEKDKKFIFTMPTSDVEISIDIKYEEKRDIALLWYSNLVLQSKAPWYVNSSSKPFASELVYGGDRSMYKITVNEPTGSILMYGDSNVNITNELYYDTAEFMVLMKLESSNKKGNVSIHKSGGTLSKEVEIGSDWTTVKIPLKEMSSTMLGDSYAIDISKLSKDDVLYISNAQVWNCSSGKNSEEEMFEKLFDVSGYKKSETNTLIGEFGAPKDRMNPFGGGCIASELAWFKEEFQNQYAWYVSKAEDKEFDVKYTLQIPRKGGSLNVSDYEDTGYMEFYVKSVIGDDIVDGTTFPITVQSSNGKKANFTVKYNASKSRNDGYMQVRIPFTYLSDMGVDLGMISSVQINGIQSIDADLLLSSFRFYTNYADVPDPISEIEPEPEPERDLPIDLDSSVLNAYLDRENIKIYVPENTYLWELLAAISLDTTESEVAIFKNGSVLTQRDTVIDDAMTMRLYRSGFKVCDLNIYYLTEDIANNLDSENLNNSTEPLIPETGDKTAPLVAALAVILSGFVVIVLGKKLYI